MTCCCVRTNIAWTAICCVVILIWVAATQDEQRWGPTEPSKSSNASSQASPYFSQPEEVHSTRSNYTVFVSLAGAAASICAAILATASARGAAYNDYQKLLIEWNKECMKEPFLSAVNDDLRAEFKSQNTDGFNDFLKNSGERRIVSFAYMQLNTFEGIYEYELRIPGRISAIILCILFCKNHHHEAWMNYFRFQVSRSSVFRDLIGRADLEQYYTMRFARFARSVLADYHSSKQGDCAKMGNLSQ